MAKLIEVTKRSRLGLVLSNAEFAALKKLVGATRGDCTELTSLYKALTSHKQKLKKEFYVGASPGLWTTKEKAMKDGGRK